MSNVYKEEKRAEKIFYREKIHATSNSLFYKYNLIDNYSCELLQIEFEVKPNILTGSSTKKKEIRLATLLCNEYKYYQ